MTRIHVAKLVVLLIQDLYPVLIIRNNIFEPAGKIFQQSGINFKKLQPVSRHIFSKRCDCCVAVVCFLLGYFLKLPDNLPLRQLGLQEGADGLLGDVGRGVEGADETVSEYVRPGPC